MSILVAPSLLAADFSKLDREIRRMERAGADWLHLDVMDGHFVPNITFGPPLVASVRKLTKLFLDAHLMISHPENFIEPFARAGANLITFHIEAVHHPERIIRAIQTAGCRAGISLKPKTPLRTVLPYLSSLDLILFMTVEPGFGGQAFMPEVLSKINAAREAVAGQKRKIHLQVDGGITAETAPQAVAAGANILVAGTAIFGNASPATVIRKLKHGPARPS